MNPDGPSGFAVACYAGDGSLDPSVGPDGNGKTLAHLPGVAESVGVAVDSADRVIVVGSSESAAAVIRWIRRPPARHRPGTSCRSRALSPRPSRPAAGNWMETSAPAPTC